MYTGLVTYGARHKSLMVVHHIIFVVTILILEMLYQMKKPYTDTTKRYLEGKRIGTMTISEFNRAVKRGQKYVLLDNYVIDVESFIGEHPGGSIMLTHNLGRDIGKYLYGAYSLENSVILHKHSHFAVKVLAKLTIARIEEENQYLTVSLSYN